MYKYMSESLAGTGHKAMSLLDVSGYDETNVEVNVYESSYKTVIYVTSRSEDFGQDVTLDVSDVTKGAWSWKGRKVGIDPLSADGLSENWGYEADGQEMAGTRLARRLIDEDEREALRDLLGAGLTDEHIIPAGNGTYRTYLPNADEIIPAVSNPQTLDDFYFATETDVLGLETLLSKSDLGGSAKSLSVKLDPYEFAEITINTVNSIMGGGNEDKLSGAWGRDIIRGNGGGDKLYGKSGKDKLYGGSGSDTLDGGNGSDKLIGGAGIDFLCGGKGSDLMTGGDGSDFFVFKSRDLVEFDTARQNKVDRITDFTLGEDKIRLDLNGVDGLEDLAMWRDNSNDQFVIAVRGADELRIQLDGDYSWSEMYMEANFEFL